jgi:hypothetical protein
VHSGTGGSKYTGMMVRIDKVYILDHSTELDWQVCSPGILRDLALVIRDSVRTLDRSPGSLCTPSRGRVEMGDEVSARGLQCCRWVAL